MELPEVEIVCEQMRKVLLDKKIVNVKNHPSPRFKPAKKSITHIIKNIDRHGKYIVITMQAPYELLCHLGMSGSLSLKKTTPKDLNPKLAELNQRYIRACWFFSDQTLMELRDVRRFGYVFWVKAGDYSKIPTLHNAGPDALSPKFKEGDFYAALRKSQRNIKVQLLSQKPVAGLGNIYIDEALWRAGISPKRKQLGYDRVSKLHCAILECLNEGLANGGTTLRDYRTFSGTKGTHQNHLNCYGRGNQPCHKCGTLLTYEKLDGRGTTYCKKCQK